VDLGGTYVNVEPFMKKLVQVPKAELDEKLALEQKRKVEKRGPQGTHT